MFFKKCFPYSHDYLENKDYQEIDNLSFYERIKNVFIQILEKPKIQ